MGVHRFRRLIGLSSVSLLIAAGALLGAQPAAAAAPYCGLVWGSGDRSASGPSSMSSEVFAARFGSHACYDRLVLDVSGPVSGWSVGYVDRLLADPSGLPVTVAGSARLRIVLHDTGETAALAQRHQLVSVRSGPIREVVGAGSFERVTSVGVGVRGRLPFRAFTLAGPAGGTRLVVDVARAWCTAGASRC